MHYSVTDMTACVKQYALTSKDTAHFVLYSVEQQAVQHTVVLCCFCGNLTVALMSCDWEAFCSTLVSDDKKTELHTSQLEYFSCTDISAFFFYDIQMSSL